MGISVLKPLLVSLLLVTVLANNDKEKYKVKKQFVPSGVPLPRQFAGKDDVDKLSYRPNNPALGGGIIARRRLRQDELLMSDVILADRVFSTQMSMIWSAEFHVEFISEIKVLNAGPQNASVEVVDLYLGKTKKVEITVNLPINGNPKLLLDIYGVRYGYGT